MHIDRGRRGMHRARGRRGMRKAGWFGLVVDLICVHWRQRRTVRHCRVVIRRSLLMLCLWNVMVRRGKMMW